MLRMFFVLLIAVLVLAGCGGSQAAPAVAPPPQSTLFEKGSNERINKLVDDWESAVPTAMKDQKIKPETIDQKVYQSSASLQEISDFYKNLTAQGWREAHKMPGINDGVFLMGYESGSTTLVINAVDASQLGGRGTLIYTVEGATQAQPTQSSGTPATH